MTGPATVRDYVVPAITAAASAAGRPSSRVVWTARPTPFMGALGPPDLALP
jgi:hypothetical protein